jgi:hypothetical protein
VLGAAPHPHWRRDREDTPSRSPQSRTRPLCNRGRHTHLRVAALPAALRASICSFASCPLDAASSGLRRSRCCSLLIELEAASSCRRSASPSPLRGHACSLNASAQRTRVRLVPGLMPAHADPCGDNVNFTGREELILRCATSAALPLKAHSAACTSLTASHVSSAIRRPDVCCRVVL